MNERFKSAFDEFVHDMRRRPEVLGILFFGSAQRNEATDASDLDFHIVVSGDEGWSCKKRMNGVPIEAYFYPQAHWERMIEQSAHVTDAFATGSIVYDVRGTTAKLSEAALRKHRLGPPALTALQRANWRITLTELLSDIEGYRGDYSSVFFGWAVTKALEGHGEFSRRWPVKPERLAPSMAAHDRQLRDGLDRYQRNPGKATASAIVQAVLAAAGGPMHEYEGPRASTQ